MLLQNGSRNLAPSQSSQSFLQRLALLTLMRYELLGRRRRFRGKNCMDGSHQSIDAFFDITHWLLSHTTPL